MKPKIQYAIQQSKCKELPTHQQKIFKRNGDMVFEQDFAQTNSTNANQEFTEQNIPAHPPTLWRYEGKDELFFGPEWDDLWSIERLRGIMSQRVYWNSRPTNIAV